MKRHSAPLCLLIALGACSSLNKTVSDASKIDYKAGAQQRSASLEVPPDLTRPGRDDRYAIEGENSVANFSDYQSNRKLGPASSESAGVLPDFANMSIGRAGNERWLVVPGTPDQVWPKLRQFWLDNGFALAVDRPDIGVLETEWTENRAKIKHDIVREVIGKVWDGAYTSPEKDRYKARVEPGVKPGTVEIFVSHRGLEEVFVGAQHDSTRWAWRATDAGLESEMLRRVMLAFGMQEDRARELIAGVAPTDRARFERAQDGGAALVFADPIEQAWRQVGLALDRSGFVVEDRDRTLGVYEIRSAEAKKPEPKKEEGFFSRLKFWESSEPAAPAPVAPEVVLTPGASYKVFVKGDSKRSLVRVLDQDGNVVKTDDANKILKVLFEQLK